MAAILVYPHRQGSPPNIDASNDLGLGHRANFHGSLPQLLWPSGYSILPWIVRRRLPTPLQRDYQSMVPSC